jgi:acid phosphatase
LASRFAAAIALLIGVAGMSACHATPARRSVATPATRSAAGATAPSGSAAPDRSASPSAGAAGHPDHIVVAIFENRAYHQIAANPAAPYLNALMARSATFTNAHGVTHPSQPNYLALFSGSTQGVTDDHCLTRLPGRPNLARQLLDAGHTFVGYSEDLPAPGYLGCREGRYAAKHNPWVNFDNVPAAANQPYTAWPTDFTTLPTVAFVVPNLCNDMHDCGTATGDAWARAHLDPYLRWADTHHSLLVVTFDENDGGAGNQILTLIAGAGVTPGTRSESVDHYSVLGTIENLYGLAPLGKAAAATPIGGLGF